MIGCSSETVSVARLHDCICLCFTDLVRNLTSVTSPSMKSISLTIHHMKLAISHVVLTIGPWTKLDDVTIKIEPF